MLFQSRWAISSGALDSSPKCNDILFGFEVDLRCFIGCQEANNFSGSVIHIVEFRWHGRYSICKKNDFAL